MPNRLISSLAFVQMILLLPAGSPAARRKLYIGQFPLSVGSRWVYCIGDSVRHRTDTAYVRIIGSRTFPDGKKAMLWRYRIQGITDTDYVVRSEDTITFYRDANRQLVRVRFVFPLVPGKQWSVNPPGSTEVHRIMTLATPAGVFRHTFKVERQPAVRNYVGGTTYWLEPRVGIVQIHRKSIDTINNQEEDALWQLISWSTTR